MMEMSSTDEGLPCGLGPRDTLRMEKGMLLSGTDFDHNRTPYEASISFIVNKDHEFIGKEPLEKSREERTEIFRGFRVEGRSLPRGGCRILKDGRQVGTVTSGGTSPVLGIPIALGFIDRSLSKEGNSVDIEIRSNLSPATVSKPKLVK
jgi:aminomethyltransferase